MKSFLYCGMPGAVTFGGVCLWDYFRCGNDPSAAGAYFLHAMIVGGFLGLSASVLAVLVVLAKQMGKG